MHHLNWLQHDPEWRSHYRQFLAEKNPTWEHALNLANKQLNFVQTNSLDDAVRANLQSASVEVLQKVRVAFLSTSTSTHLHSAIRVAGIRRNLWIDTFEPDYGQYYQSLLDQTSKLHEFSPHVVVFAFDAHYVCRGVDASSTADDVSSAMEKMISQMRDCWRIAQRSFACQVIQQPILEIWPSILGGNEHRLPGSRQNFLQRLNARLRVCADEDGVDIFGLSDAINRHGIETYHDPALWHRSKQEISPIAAPIYGDLVTRVISARLGKSFKCLVLDLDNTLWGGVVGDDGPSGIIIGQGSPLGEAFLSVQDYARELSRRGIMLAVSSKNDEANALAPFQNNPDMILKRRDILSFYANWNDKAANIRLIAAELNIGLDSIVFVDDNPFERDLVRQALPMVAVPEIPDDPAMIPQTISNAGYFESVSVTSDDLRRATQYTENRDRGALQSEVTDMATYLKALGMELIWQRFDFAGLQRIVQLCNKTNQFNLTTTRYSEQDVRSIMSDELATGLQFRLLDRFGDNGMISIVVGQMSPNKELLINNWLMSCRVLGRDVETAVLNIIAAEATRLGALSVVGRYVPTPKNGLVSQHYLKLGFKKLESAPDDGYTARLALQDFSRRDTFIKETEGL